MHPAFTGGQKNNSLMCTVAGRILIVSAKEIVFRVFFYIFIHLFQFHFVYPHGAPASIFSVSLLLYRQLYSYLYNRYNSIRQCKKYIMLIFGEHIVNLQIILDRCTCKINSYQMDEFT
jgi:hypothetical protein